VVFLRPSQMTETYMDLIHTTTHVIREAYQASAKPVICIVEGSADPHRQMHIYNIMRGVIESGRPLFYSFPGAAEALKLVVQQNERRNHP
jgi:hypothetical protein